MNRLDLDYQNLLKDILENGVKKETRNGETKSVFGRQIRHKMSEGFPLLTTKKMYFKGIVTELLWFLRGDTNIKYLVDNDCNIWNGDAIKNWMRSGKSYHIRRNLYLEPKYEILSVAEIEVNDFPSINSAGWWGTEKNGVENLWINFNKLGGYPTNIKKIVDDAFLYKIKTDEAFAKQWGELGPVYGRQWRKWSKFGYFDEYDAWNNSSFRVEGFEHIDQIANLISELKTNPDSRRLMVNAWNVGDLDQMVLPPCHYGFQVYTRELSQQERWDILRKKCRGKSTIPWDRMALPSHEWMDKVETIGAVGLNGQAYEGIEISVPRRAISLMWNQRSVDTFLGLPFNIASYGLLLTILAEMTNMVPDELIGNLGDTHLYLNHITQAKEQIGYKLTVKERMDWWFKNHKPNRDVCDYYDMQPDAVKSAHFDECNVPTTSRPPLELPSLRINTEFWLTESGECGVGPLTSDVDMLIKSMCIGDFQLENYISYPPIKAPLSN